MSLKSYFLLLGLICDSKTKPLNVLYICTLCTLQVWGQCAHVRFKQKARKLVHSSRDSLLSANHRWRNRLRLANGKRL